MQDAVHITHGLVGADGKAVFEDRGQPYGRDGSPFAITARLAAASIRFGWAPAGFRSAAGAGTADRLLVALEGRLDVELASGLRRQFGLGDLLQLTAAGARGAVRRDGADRPLRYAEITLSGAAPGAAEDVVSVAGDPAGASFLRTYAGADGRSRTEAGLLPYGAARDGERLTAAIPLVGFQCVLAPDGLNYDWHRAPQRQIVIFLSGGAEMENGQGERHRVLPGGIYFGEDDTGQGHITRAIDGRERFAIFAHLG